MDLRRHHHPAPGTTGHRDPWDQLHRNTYELATEAVRFRARDIGQTIIANHRADPQRHTQHARYLRSVAPDQLSMLTREADHLRPAVHRLSALETQLDRWTRLHSPEASPTASVEVGGYLADWLGARLAGHQPLSSGDQEVYRAWSAARRLGDPAAVFQPRRITLRTTAALANFAQYLAEAARESPSRAARADARSRLRRIAITHPSLTVEIPVEEEAAPAAA